MNEISTHEHRLTLSEVLEWMVADGLVGRDAAEALKTERRLHGGRIHPLVVIADQKWRQPDQPARLLEEALTVAEQRGFTRETMLISRLLGA